MHMCITGLQANTWVKMATFSKENNNNKKQQQQSFQLYLLIQIISLFIGNSIGNHKQ